MPCRVARKTYLDLVVHAVRDDILQPWEDFLDRGMLGDATIMKCAVEPARVCDKRAATKRTIERMDEAKEILALL